MDVGVLLAIAGLVAGAGAAWGAYYYSRQSQDRLTSRLTERARRQAEENAEGVLETLPPPDDLAEAGGLAPEEELTELRAEIRNARAELERIRGVAADERGELAKVLRAEVTRWIRVNVLWNAVFALAGVLLGVAATALFH